MLVRGGEAALELGGAAEGGEAVPQGAEAAAAVTGEGAATLATYDGRSGAATSTSGALTLRTGDLLVGRAGSSFGFGDD